MATDVLALVFFATLFSMFFFFWTEFTKITRQQERAADALCEIANALKSMQAAPWTAGSEIKPAGAAPMDRA